MDKSYTPKLQKTTRKTFTTNEAIQRGEYEAKIEYFDYRISNLEKNFESFTNNLENEIDKRFEFIYLKKAELNKKSKLDFFFNFSPIIISVISVGITIYLTFFKK